MAVIPVGEIPGVFDGVDGQVVVRDQIVLAQENIQFQRIEVVPSQRFS
jgi:hypothetical protein